MKWDGGKHEIKDHRETLEVSSEWQLGVVILEGFGAVYVQLLDHLGTIWNIGLLSKWCPR